jgi:hypothetical protein
MKNVLVIILLNLLSLSVFSGCTYAIRVDGPYEGRIVDADTGEPIEGVVVLATWSREYPNAGGASHEYHDAEETVTDENGEYIISGKGVKVLSNVIPPYLLIFKAGYSYLGGSYESWKFSSFAKKMIKWEGEKAIIPLRKLTIEERKREMGPPSPPSDAPKEKIKLMIDEINKDRSEQGLGPIDVGR